MVKQTMAKRYSSPELIVHPFVKEDVITTSSNDNIGAIPTDWWDDVDTQGGGF